MIATTFAESLRPVTAINGVYPPSPRGEYLLAFREALGPTTGSAHRVLDIGLAAYSGLEAGRLVFADRATWARVELALCDTAGAGWCGWVAHEKVWIAAREVGAVSWARDTTVGALDFLKASQRVTFAAALQHQTVKSGILYRLAAALALEAGEPEEAVRLARLGIVPDIGPMPPWLSDGLLAVVDATVDVA
jgi:hypothetical protein